MRWLFALLLVVAGCPSKGTSGTAGPEPSGTPVLTVELPKASMSTNVQVVFAVTLQANGSAAVNGKPIAGDEEILALARAARGQTAELRAVIMADKAVTHGRVIHVLDLLKQAGISQIAFGVEPFVSQPR